MLETFVYYVENSNIGMSWILLVVVGIGAITYRRSDIESGVGAYVLTQSPICIIF